MLSGAVFAVCMAGTTLPTPLYGLYQEKFGFSELTVTVVYAVYAFGVIGVLLLAGNASDTVGRRPVLLWGLGLRGRERRLLPVRHRSGLAVRGAAAVGPVRRPVHRGRHGVRDGAGTARAAPPGPRSWRRPPTWAGSAAVRCSPGCSRSTPPWPLYLPFAVHLVLMAGSAAVLLRLPETVTERRPLRTVRPQRPGLPPQVRAVFGPAAIASFVGFALFGVFTSVSPAFLAESLDVHNHAVSGLVVALAFFASIAGQLAVGRVGVGTVAAAGLRRAPRPGWRCSRARCGGTCWRWWC